MSKASLSIRDGAYYVKVNYYDSAGVRRTLHRRAKDQADAERIAAELTAQVAPVPVPSIAPISTQAAQSASPAASAITFIELAALYRKTKFIPARYVGEKKICGMRNPESPGYMVGVCERFFGERQIDSITPFDLSEFRLHLMNKPTLHGTQRSMAATNRTLEQLRGVFRFAVKAQLLARNPFDNAFEPLIVTSAENHRDRVLTFEEEKRLLTAIESGEQAFKRSYLRPLVIAALDTAARKNELLTLEWRDIDLDAGLIQVRAIHAKTGKARVLPITPRLWDELTKLHQSRQDERQRVFQCGFDIRKGFDTACRNAGISDLRFHDLRHTAITRLVRAGVPASEVMKISGHSQMATFMRYVNPGADSLRSAADALAKLVSEFVN